VQWAKVYCICRSNASQYAAKPDIGPESRLLTTPPAFDFPVGGGDPVGIFAMPLGTEKLEWCGYQTVKKFEDMFIRLDVMNTHRDTHT